MPKWPERQHGWIDYSPQLLPHKEEIVVPLTQTQLAAAVADRAEITKAEAKRVPAECSPHVLA
jgi:hypothetical protein